MVLYLGTADNSNLPQRNPSGQIKPKTARISPKLGGQVAPIGKTRRFEPSFCLAGGLSPPLDALIPWLYTATSCRHGGTRNSNNCCTVQTLAVMPAAIAGVHFRHFLGEPVPRVGKGCGNPIRKAEWGKQKL